MAQLMVLGVFHTKGLSKKSNPPKPYEISKLIYGREFQAVNTESRVLNGAGYEAQEMDMDPRALSSFQGKKFPALMDVEIEFQPNNPQRNWVVGCK